MGSVDTQKTWHQALDVIKQQISSANFRTWFSKTEIEEIKDEHITLIVPSAFIKQQLLSRYSRIINEAVSAIVGRELELQFTIDSTRFNKESKEVKSSEFELEFTQNIIPNPSLNTRYTLQNYVVGFTNNLAYAAAQAVVQNPGTSYNPLFIYGPSGVGKTHLMQAVGNTLFAKNPHLKIIYASSERFMVDFVDSIQTKRTADFRAKYRSCDLLLIDDIQFIAGKDSTQEEFFHTFNELHSKSSQIILTSDRPPNEMAKLESRLMSRFQGGLMVDIQLPDFDTRVAILKAKLTERGETLPEDCLTLIASTIESNTRELEGKLIQIMSLCKLSNLEPNLETVQKFLGNRPEPQSRVVLEPKKIIGGINQFFNIRMADLTGPKRQKELVIPRQLAMFLLYEECKLPMERIGQMLGGRDHTTILHGIEKIREAQKRDREIQRLLIELKQVVLS